VWTYDPTSGGWHEAGSAQTSKVVYIGDIADVDDDGQNEVLITNTASDSIEIWGYDGSTSLTKEAVIRHCAPDAKYHEAAGDLNGNGIPEVILQCSHGDDIEIWEHGAGGYAQIGAVAPL